MFGKIVKNTVADKVIEQITQHIQTGILKPGDKLPPERQLAEQLAVSRPTLREALRAMEYAGILKTRIGDGVFIADGHNILASNLNTTRLMRQYKLEEMIETRRVLEAATTRLAVIRGTADDIESITKIHETADKSLNSIQEFITYDYAFHTAIAETAGNSVLSDLWQTMRSMMRDFNTEMMATLKGRKDVLQQHTAIVEAICARNEEQAVAAMDMHLDGLVSAMRTMRAIGS